jgi:hypothetical protein
MKLRKVQIGPINRSDPVRLDCPVLPRIATRCLRPISRRLRCLPTLGRNNMQVDISPSISRFLSLLAYMTSPPPSEVSALTHSH